MDTRRIGLTALRGAALTLSIGIVAGLMVRASSGCSDKSDIGADPASAPEATAAGAVASSEPESFIPASKSMGGEGRRLLAPSSEAAAAPASASSNPNVAVEDDPGFFPASKSGRPIPPRQKQEQKNAPIQQQNAQ